MADSFTGAPTTITSVLGGGVVRTSVFAAPDPVAAIIAAELDAHVADTTGVHGIADTAALVVEAATNSAWGIHKNTDSPTYGAWYSVGNAPGSMGFPGEGSPAEAYAPLVLYSKFGDSVGGSNAPILKTTQAGAVLANYYGPTADDSAETFSCFVGMKDTGTPYTQEFPATAFEAIAQIEGGNDMPNDEGELLAIGARTNVAGTSHVARAIGVKVAHNTTGSGGTTDTYFGFFQPVAADATNAYGIYTADKIASESGFALGKTAYDGSVSVILTGNADANASMALIQGASTTDLTQMTLRAGAGQTNAMAQFKDSAGVNRATVSSAGFFITRGTGVLVQSGVSVDVFSLRPDTLLTYHSKVADLAAPAANAVSIYQRDDGTGLGEIVARFPTGAIKRIATEHDGGERNFGIVSTFAPGVTGSAAAWGGANESRYARVLAGGTISKVRIHVGTSSGNISVAVHRNSGSGLSAVPGARVITSGSVACPAAGVADVPLGGSVDVRPGDWLAMSADNVTATFTMVSNANSTLYAGTAYRGAAEHPIPSLPGALTASTSRLPLMIGVP